MCAFRGCVFFLKMFSLHRQGADLGPDPLVALQRDSVIVQWKEKRQCGGHHAPTVKLLLFPAKRTPAEVKTVPNIVGQLIGRERQVFEDAWDAQSGSARISKEVEEQSVVKMKMKGRKLCKKCRNERS